MNKAVALRTTKTSEFMRENGIVGLVADKTHKAPKVESLLVDLGQISRAIPFYAVFPGSGGEVITYDSAILTQGQLLDMLTRAGPSREAPATETAMAP